MWCSSCWMRDGTLDVCSAPDKANREHASEQQHEWTCRMHNTKSRRGPVWKRLEADAWARQGVPCHQYSFWAGHGPGAKETVGYTQAVADRHISMPPKGFEMIDPPASRLHRLTLERYRKHFPSEFYASIRPHTSTTNQTLRCTPES